MSLAPDVLFDRQVVVTVDELEMAGLDVAFNISKTRKPEPNSCEVRLFNLGRGLRQELASKAKGGALYVTLSAGHRGKLSQLYRGDLRDVFSMQDQARWVTTITSGDGETARRNARIRRAFPRNTKVEVVLRELAEALGVGTGNSGTFLRSARALQGGSGEFVSGTTVSGNVAEELTTLLRSAGVEWSIQDGELQLADLGAPVPGEVVVLTPTTGLIGSPEPGQKGVVRCTALIVPGLQPGGLMEVLSQEVRGVFRIERVDYAGDLSSAEWYAHLEGSEVKS